MCVHSIVQWVWLVGSGFVLGLEYWLGKTEKVKASSIVDAIILGVGALAVLILKREIKDEH